MRLLVTLIMVAAALPAAASTGGSNLGGMRGGDFEAGSVIDEKCLACHNRARIEKGAKERKSLEKVLGKMQAKGAVVTQREREVLQHFWKAKAYKDR